MNSMDGCIPHQQNKSTNFVLLHFQSFAILWKEYSCIKARRNPCSVTIRGCFQALWPGWTVTSPMATSWRCATKTVIFSPWATIMTTPSPCVSSVSNDSHRLTNFGKTKWKFPNNLPTDNSLWYTIDQQRNKTWNLQKKKKKKWTAFVEQWDGYTDYLKCFALLFFTIRVMIKEHS